MIPSYDVRVKLLDIYVTCKRMLDTVQPAKIFPSGLWNHLDIEITVALQSKASCYVLVVCKESCGVHIKCRVEIYIHADTNHSNNGYKMIQKYIRTTSTYIMKNSSQSIIPNHLFEIQSYSMNVLFRQWFSTTIRKSKGYIHRLPNIKKTTYVTTMRKFMVHCYNSSLSI